MSLLTVEARRSDTLPCKIHSRWRYRLSDISRGCDFSRSRFFLDDELAPLVAVRIIKSFVKAIRWLSRSLSKAPIFIPRKNDLSSSQLFAQFFVCTIAIIQYSAKRVYYSRVLLPWRYKSRVAFPFQQRSPIRPRKRRGNPYRPPRCVPEEPAVSHPLDAVPPICSPLKEKCVRHVVRHPYLGLYAAITESARSAIWTRMQHSDTRVFS